MLRHAIRDPANTWITLASRCSFRHLTSSVIVLAPEKTKSHSARGKPFGLTTDRPAPPLNPIHGVATVSAAPKGGSKELEATFQLLCKSLTDEDGCTVKKHWETLNSTALVASLGPLHYEELSAKIATLFVHCRTPSGLAGHVTVLEDIAVAACAQGFPQGLLATMHAHLSSMDPDSLRRAYDRFRTMLKDNDKGKGSQELADGWSGDAELDVFKLFPKNPSSTHDMIEKPLPLKDKLQAEMLMYAIAGSALRNDFLQAVYLVIEANCILTGGQVRAFMSGIGSDFAQTKKVESFLRRSVTASLVARKNSLPGYISQLTKDKATLSLHALCNDIVEGLTGHDPWLTLDSAAVSAKTPLVVIPHVWPTLLLGFLKNGKLDWAEKLWDDMAALGITPNVHIWRALIVGYGDLGMADQADRAWKAMLQQGHVPDVKSYSLMIHALLMCRRTEAALDHLAAFQKQVHAGKLPATDDEVRVVLNNAIHTLIRTKDETSALALLYNMETEGPTPDLNSITPFLSIYSKRDLKAFGQMLQKINTYKLEPTDSTYTLILTALLPVRDDAVSVVFDFMQKHGRKPDISMYTSVINALMAEQTMVAFHTVLRLLQELETSKSPDVRPTEVTYTSILCGIHRKNWMDRKTAREYAALIFRKMMKQRLHSLASYHIIIRACLENPEPEGLQTAMFYYREMKRRHVPMLNDTWYILLVGLQKRQEWDLADTVLQDLKQSDVSMSPGLVRFNT
ncbi:hypothetical protein BC835DRAFT_1375573 [Cytidiella melzeri]|nr:hypothetical protein BC835DRAFT_1375573 [Cytidiella melzeri]